MNRGRLVTVAALVSALALPLSADAQKMNGSCDVSPTTVTQGQQVTVTASANVPFDFDLVSPSGIVYVWPSSTPGSVTYAITAPSDETGGWLVEVNALQLQSNKKKLIATCPFSVT